MKRSLMETLYCYKGMLEDAYRKLDKCPAEFKENFEIIIYDLENAIKCISHEIERNGDERKLS